MLLEPTIRPSPEPSGPAGVPAERRPAASAPGLVADGPEPGDGSVLDDGTVLADASVVVEDVGRRRSPGLSPSRANDFLQCPLLFRFRVVDRRPEPPSAAAVRGTLVHSVLERLFDVPSGRRDLVAAKALLDPCWAAMTAAQPDCANVLEGTTDLDAFFGAAAALLETYFTLEDPNRLQPADRELVVRTDLEDGLELRGIVDRIDVAPDGAIRIVDYQTGKSPRAGYESAALFQMRFYALVVSRLRGRVPAMLQLVYLGDGTLVRHVPDVGEIAATEKRIRALWGGIRSTAEQDSWAPRPTALCGWCSHKALCPAFGGTAPQADPDAVERAIGVRPLLASGALKPEGS